MDWQHTCYTFSPFLPFEKDEFDEWLIPVFPNGDHTFFLSWDLGNGIAGDGINCSIGYFGAEMIRCLEEDMPKMLRK